MLSVSIIPAFLVKAPSACSNLGLGAGFVFPASVIYSKSAFSALLLSSAASLVGLPGWC